MPKLQIQTEPCMKCGGRSLIAVEPRQYRSWMRGTLIQDAFPDLSNAERETLKSGIHRACWEEMFANPE